jgi:hypothetical protein
MAEKSNDDLYQVLMAMSRDIGSIKATGDATAETLTKHILDDQALGQRIVALELTGATQRGAATVWSLVTGALGGSLGVAATFITTYWLRHK